MADDASLTIGKVVEKLSANYPDISVSKLRFLEEEGLVEPSRTAGGYRVYSPRDVKRIETILHLQKTRFLPLAVIKDELERMDSGQASVVEEVPGASVLDRFETDDEQTANKLHPIERIPEVLGVSVSFVRSLEAAGVIGFKRSPAGRDLVDGHDLPLIRICDQLRQFGIEPKFLRQYVNAADRETGIFEQALTVYGRRDSDLTEGERTRLSAALDTMLTLTNALREVLVRRGIASSYRGLEA